METNDSTAVVQVVASPRPVYLGILKVQAQLRKVANDATNPHFRNRYATLGEVWANVREAVNAAGLIVYTILGDGYAETFIADAATGDAISSRFPVSLTQGPQQIGSALTYARRYSLCSMLQIVTGEDDDGELAQRGSVPPPKPPRRKGAPNTDINIEGF